MAMAMPKPGDLTANDLNATVYQYLRESGFLHTAFNFFHEARLERCGIQGMKIPQGTLIRVMQKGLRYIEFQANSDIGDVEDLQDLHHFNTLDLLTKDVAELKVEIACHRKPDSLETAKEKNKDSLKNVKVQKTEASTPTVRKPEPSAPAETADAPKTDSSKKKFIVRIPPSSKHKKRDRD